MAILQVNLRPARHMRRPDRLQPNNTANVLNPHISRDTTPHPIDLSTMDLSAVNAPVRASTANLSTSAAADNVAKYSYTDDMLSGRENIILDSDIQPAKPWSEPPLWQRIVWNLSPFTTIGRAVNSAARRLRESGGSNAQLDAQVLLAHVLEVDRSWLFANHDYKLDAAETKAYTDLVARRAEHEPVAYLIGRKEFYGLEFMVDSRVLIPRPETELLVDAVLGWMEYRDNSNIRIADVGTGSGAIALSIANNYPQANIYALDVSQDALDVASRNVKRLDKRNQVTLLQGDLLEPLPKKVDIIAANLPYISPDVYNDLVPDVREYEPSIALQGGTQGLDPIFHLLQQAPEKLNPGGGIFLEIAHDQGQKGLELCQKLLPSDASLDVRKDYGDRDRLITIQL